MKTILKKVMVASLVTTSAAVVAQPKKKSAEALVEVQLCDGQTKVTVPAGTAGTSVAGQLMAEWLRKNPNSNWEAEERERHTLQPAADNRELIGQVQGQTYGRVTEQEHSPGSPPVGDHA